MSLSASLSIKSGSFFPGKAGCGPVLLDSENIICPLLIFITRDRSACPAPYSKHVLPIC